MSQADASCELTCVYDRLEVLKKSIASMEPKEGLHNGWFAVLCDIQREVQEVSAILGYGGLDAPYRG